jgi:hypothetical protein
MLCGPRKPFGQQVAMSRLTHKVRSIRAHVQGESLKAWVPTVGRFSSSGRLHIAEKAIESSQQMNVIDIRTGRPLGEPAKLIAHFEIIDEPCRRRQMPTDLVGFTAVVSRKAAYRLAAEASAQIGVSVALRSAVVSGIHGNAPVAPAEVAPFSICMQPEPEAGEDAWLFSAELTRKSVGTLARLAHDLGAYEQRLAS